MKVYLESPFRHSDPEVHKGFVAYAQLCAEYSAIRFGENPFVSHLLFTQFLDDEDPDDRILGMNLGFEWAFLCDKTVICQDFGISEGMQLGIENALHSPRPIEYRNLLKEDLAPLLEEFPALNEFLIT